MELLAINQSLSERRIIFVPRLLKFSHGLVYLDSVIQFSTFSKMSGFCGTVPNGPVGLVVSFNICQGLKC